MARINSFTYHALQHLAPNEQRRLRPKPEEADILWNDMAKLGGKQFQFTYIRKHFPASLEHNTFSDMTLALHLGTATVTLELMNRFVNTKKTVAILNLLTTPAFSAHDWLAYLSFLETVDHA